MTDRRVDDQMPKSEEQDAGRELHALGESPGDDGRGDDGKRQLKGDPEVLRKARGQTVRRLDCDAVQEQGLKAADEAVGRLARDAERQAVADDEPQQGHDHEGRR
jgi:hypothetical protein